MLNIFYAKMHNEIFSFQLKMVSALLCVVLYLNIYLILLIACAIVLYVLLIVVLFYALCLTVNWF